jgi:hypothetical protein
MEVLLGHLDGYAGNTNNFLVYHANDGKFRFLPWGVDTTFGTFGELPALSSAILPARLCANAPTAADYVTAMQTVLDVAWDEAAILAEIDRMEALIDPEIEGPAGDGLAMEIDRVRSFVDRRRAAIDDALAGSTPCEGNQGPRASGAIDANFATRWDTLDAHPLSTGSGTMDLEIDDAPVVVTQVGAVAGTPPDGGGDLLEIVARLEDDSIVTVLVMLGTDPPAIGTAVPVNGIVLRADASGSTAPLGGLDATLTLTEAGTTSGAPFAGSLVGSF